MGIHRSSTVLLLLILAMPAQTVLSAPITASTAAEIKTDEIDEDLRFANAQGSVNGTFTSYGVLEFNTASLAGTSSVPAIRLSMTQANAFFTADGAVNFYHTGDMVSDLSPTGPLRADETVVPTGIAVGDLEPLTLLGTAPFVETATGDVNVYAFPVDATLESTLLASISAGDPIRFVFAAGEEGTSATFAGMDGGFDGILSPPQFEIVPEPSSLIGLVWGTLLIPVLRRWRFR